MVKLKDKHLHSLLNSCSHLHLASLLFGRYHVMALVLLHSAQHTNTHLVCAAVQLQAFLVLWADLPVQMPNFIHQLVPLEGPRLIVRFQVLLTV